jgi:hypothetical protein
VIAALLAIFTHVQVLPSLDRQHDLQPGCVIYAEPNPTTRLSLSIVKGNQGVTAKLGAKWRF